MDDSIIRRLNEALSGRYAVEREIGEGGMATVYLARDEKHNRNVALKVLKPELAAVVGAERFLAEIETTAQLQHPHILPLFDSGEADGFLFYVMPYVEGETLRDRIDREKQLPVEEAIGIGVAVANALHAAHQAGVVHRDIKPGNILMSQGEPLVADFGIALAVGTAGGSRLTETGLSVGTPYYMSPEQATGDQVIGAPSDIYALAAVVYEMLVGEPPYVGNTAQAVLGKILQGEPVSATAVRRSIPANVDAALRKALEKLPADRFRTAQEFARALGDPSFRHGALEGSAAGAGRGLWNPLSITTTAVAVLAVVGSVIAVASTPEAAPEQILRFETPFRPGQEMVGFSARAFDISPDGSMLVYVGPPSAGTATQLWLRRWDDLEATPIRGAESALDPAISPDGTSIAFVQGGEVHVLPLQGGPSRALGVEGFYPRWSTDGHLYVSASHGAVRVSAAGGAVDSVSSLAGDGDTHAVNETLPSGLALVWVVHSDGAAEVHILDPESGEMRKLLDGRNPNYLESGHLVYQVDDQILVAPFDGDAGEITGPAVAMLGGVNEFKISDSGELFYSTGASGGAQQELVWVDRSGDATPVEPGWRIDTGNANAGWSISPDGSRIALREATEAGLDIWIKEVDGGPRSRLTLAGEEDWAPVWGPEPDVVTFLSSREGNLDVFTRRADGTGEPRLVLDLEERLAEATWSPDGTWLVVRTAGVGGTLGARDILGIRPGTDEEPMPLLSEPHDEVGPAFSPDGRWLAYTSNETGRHEVFVRPFPNVDDARWQVSTQGGFAPKWARDGSEIFFLNGNRQMMAAAVRPEGSSFQVVERTALFDVPATFLVSDIFIAYDVGEGERQFLMARQYAGSGSGEEQPPDAVLVLNWILEIRERVPVP